MISREEAKQLASKPEWPLIEQSYPPALDRMDTSQLRDHATRSRELHEKYRELARSQHRSSKESQIAGEGENARTDQKARLFEEARHRYEERLEQRGESFPG